MGNLTVCPTFRLDRPTISYTRMLNNCMTICYVRDGNDVLKREIEEKDRSNELLCLSNIFSSLSQNTRVLQYLYVNSSSLASG